MNYSANSLEEDSCPGITSTINGNLLENKVIDLFSQLNITISKSDIEDCHRLGKANPKNTIVQFVNRTFCNDALETNDCK